MPYFAIVQYIVHFQIDKISPVTQITPDESEVVLGATVKINAGGGTGHWQDVDVVLGQLAVVDSAILLQREGLERYAASI